MREILAQTAVIRGLHPRSEVKLGVIDRTVMIEKIKTRVRIEVPEAAIRGEGDFLKAFGFLPSDYDFEAGMYALVQSQVAGFYEPKEKTMFLMDDLSSQEAEPTLSHELVHALQDQHYGLDDRMAYHPESSDSSNAIHCLAEGDATSAMLDYLLKDRGANATSLSASQLETQLNANMALSPEMAQVPTILRRSLLAPYIDGLALVHRARNAGGWKAVDALWANPPTTSEQVLHEDKLKAREPEDKLPPPTILPLGEGWQQVHADVYGEQGLRIAMEEWMPRRVAADFSAGWGGDHAVVARRGNDLAAAWAVRFDVDAPGRSSSREAGQAIALISKAWGIAPKKSQLCKTTQERLISVVLRGRDLILVAVPARLESDACSFAARWSQAISP